MSNKKRKITPKQIISLILAGVVCFMVVRFLTVIIPEDAQTVDTAKGVQYLETMESADGDKTLDEVRAVQKKYSEKTSKAQSRQSYKNKNFKALFKDKLIVGDSITEAISEYNVLNDDEVISKIGANASYIGEKMGDIVKAKPQVIILHFGLNTMGSKAQAQPFINEYEKQIKVLQKKLPKTKIYVDSILPVSKGAIKQSPEYKNIGYYNTKLKAMAAKLKVGYIDHTDLWKSYKTNYYDLDGIHPVMVYYTEQYLPTILEKVGG